MANAKKSLYEILEVSPGASLSEIQAAHGRLRQVLLSGKPGLSREDVDFRLKVIDVALHTLSDPVSRGAYDAQQSVRKAPAPAAAPPGADAVKIAGAMDAYQKVRGAAQTDDGTPLKVISATVGSSLSALKMIFRVIAGLAVLAVVIKISMAILAARPGGGPAKAEDKVIIQEYYQTHGVRPGSRIEADLLEVENRRKESERHAAAREKEQAEERERRFVEDARRTGAQVHENLRREEERARYEEEQRKQRLEHERLAQQEADRQAERARVEEARRRLEMDSSSR